MLLAAAMMECGVLGGGYAIFVQGLLFIVTVLVLVYKYKVSPAGRTPTQFILDSSKQMAGAGWLHVMNLGFAIVLKARKTSDECTWYWLEIMVDTTIGVAIEYYLLRAFVWFVQAAKSRDAAEEITSGVYVDGAGRFLLWSYFMQLSTWLLIVTGMKIVLVLMLVMFSGILIPVAEAVLHPFMEYAALKLLVVMILTPMVMNSLQFWLVDNIFIHARHSPTLAPGTPRTGPSFARRQPYSAVNES